MSTFAKIAYLNALLLQNARRLAIYNGELAATEGHDQRAARCRVAGAEARAAELQAELATYAA